MNLMAKSEESESEMKENKVKKPDEIHFVNPFVHKMEWNDPVDKIKTAILTVFLLPFRIVLIIFFLLIAWVCAYIGLHGLSRKELKEKPISGWRRQVRQIANLSMRAFLFCGTISYIKVKGQRAKSTEAPIIVAAPHTSFYDSLCVVICGPPAVVAKSEAASLPFLGKLIDYTQPIYVCREDPDSRHNTIKEIIERANSKEDWPQILIFPEGTCTNRTSLIQFKPGAFYPGVPIQPILVRYPNKMDTITWTWEGPDAISLLWRTLTQFHTFCEIEFLPVYVPNEEEKRDPRLYANNVRNIMANALGIPISDYTFDDCKMMTYLKNIDMPYAAYIADIEKLRKQCGLDKTSMEEKVISNTPSINEDNCFVNLKEFAARLEINPDDEPTTGLFTIFLKDSKKDVIDFREYLLSSLFLVTLYKPKYNFVRVLFQLYGTNGQINRDKLYDVLKYVIKITPKEADAVYMKIDSANVGNISYEMFSKYVEEHLPNHHKRLIKNNDPNSMRLK